MRKDDERGKTVTSSNPIANTVPGSPGQVREKGVCWCCSSHGQPSGGGPAAAAVALSRCAAGRSSAESCGSAPRFEAKRGGRRPRRGRPLGGETVRGTPGLAGGSQGRARRGAPPSPLRWEWVVCREGGWPAAPVPAPSALRALLPGGARAERGAGRCGGGSLGRNSSRRPWVRGAGADIVLAAAVEGVNVGWLESKEANISVCALLPLSAPAVSPRACYPYKVSVCLAELSKVFFSEQNYNCYNSTVSFGSLPYCCFLSLVLSL